MLEKKNQISRRNFIKQSLVGLGALAVSPYLNLSSLQLEEWPQNEMLGRNTVYSPSALPIRSNPDPDADVVRYLQEDEVVVWQQEVIGKNPVGRPNRRWVQTPEGFVYTPSLQPVKNLPNKPVDTLPESNGERGMWVEVTVPYVNMELVNPPARAPWLNEVQPIRWRLYYGQVIWVDEIKTSEDGSVLYRLNERYGSYGDIFFADAIAFKVITPEEIAPIHPEAEEKRIIVNANQQNLICYEGNNEVYFCRVSTGRKLDDYGNPADTWVTPTGTHWVWRKLISLHMSGGGTGAGWDTMAIAWTSLFVGEGVAIHSTFWHNDFGTPKSHGCVNVSAEDAKWIFRWTTPYVPYNPGDITDNTYKGTKIEVIDPLY